ncbi:MAG TPA: SusD/RagB family nutrient-binding outer membrane lipoprotein, partial [Chitinophagaceae bacterium]|nr:SusD/RagB family nutrient-binding outer membrane lipoprotein [Chitinophagaceae bacterium]
MKLKQLVYSIPLAAIVIMAGTGCRKSQFNINQNPNDPTDSTVAYDVVLPAALEGSGQDISTLLAPVQRWIGYWSRSGTFAPNVIEETYQITTGFGNVVWNNAYDNNYDYSVVQKKANVAGAAFYEGIARIMKAHNFQALVDVYGNIPYTQALKGSTNPTPAYDKGIDIYKDLLREIDAGMALIKNAVIEEDNPNKDIWSNDILFGTGSINDSAAQKLKWYQFGNTLKLRLLIHAYAVPAINKATEIAIIDAEGSGYLASDALVQPGYAADKPMPFFATYKTTAAGTVPAASVLNAANHWGIEYYKGDGDPRVPRFYEAGTDGMVGVPYGIPPVAQYAKANVAGIGPGLYRTSNS